MTSRRLPPLNTLRGFEAAARLGSFHKAADELHLTQSAISQQIRSLETAVGQPLFRRSGRSVQLTDAGHDLLSTTQALLQQLGAGLRRLDQYSKPNQLVVNTTPAFARHWLLPRLTNFHAAYPHVDLWLFTTDEPPQLASQTIDVAIRPDITAQPDCAFRALRQDRLYPACHPSQLDLPLASRTTLHGERDMDWSHWAVQSGVDIGQKPNGLNFSDPGLLLDAACIGLGIALVSEVLGAHARSAGTLVPLSELTIRGPTWSSLVHNESATDPITCCFCDWVDSQLV